MLQDTWHKIEVGLNFGELNPLLKWVEEHCSSNWNYEIIESAGRDAGIYRFYFREDRDAVAFTLWKT
jgi:hypothetical protein